MKKLALLHLLKTLQRIACEAIIAKTRALAASFQRISRHTVFPGNRSMPPRLSLATKEESNVSENRSRSAVIDWDGDFCLCADCRQCWPGIRHR
jgi:hypothetical protein